jgi:CHRD domain-containing protein
MRKNRIHIFVVGALVAALAGSSIALAGGGKKGHGKGSGKVSAHLDGYQETPLSINTTGSGRFTATISSNQITFRLDYSNLSGPPSMAHIHFGQRHTTGNVVAFLCGGGSKPACPATPSGSVTGTIVPADVLAIPAQGFNAGDFASLVRAIRAHATYANMHTAKFPSGEIRGQIKGGGHHDDDEDEDDDD